MEEVQKTAVSKQTHITVQQISTQQHIVDLPKVIPMESNQKTASPRPQLVSTEVQTINKVDLATQTSLEMISLKRLTENERTKETPTKETKSTSTSTRNPPSTKTSSNLFSPKRKQLTTKPSDYSNTDLTKVSSLDSPSPIIIPSPSTIVLSNSSSSSLSASSMTNITSRMTSPSPRDLLETNRSTKYSSRREDHEMRQRHPGDQNDDDDDDSGNEIFETDEILQILLRKRMFYESKLKYK